MANEAELERTLEAGIIALLTVAIQIRDGKKGEPSAAHTSLSECAARFQWR